MSIIGNPIMICGVGALKIMVNVETGSTVTATKDGSTYNGVETSTGVYEIEVPEYGTYTVTATKSGDTVSRNVVVNEEEVTLSYSDVVAYTSAQSGVTYTYGLAGLTDEDLSVIAKAISNNSAITTDVSEVWISVYNRKISIGDQISYTMGGTSYSFRVMGFNHYALTTSTAYGSATATGKAGILMQMVDCFNTTQAMESSMTSSTGWNNSDLRAWMNGTMLGYLPSATQSAIKQVNILTATSVSSATINTTADKLFLPAEVEIFGSATYAKGGTTEGTRYAWYKANSTAANRVKKVSGSASTWWERSPHTWAASIADFCFVYGGGDAGYSYASRSYGVSPCFCY